MFFVTFLPFICVSLSASDVGEVSQGTCFPITLICLTLFHFIFFSCHRFVLLCLSIYNLNFHLQKRFKLALLNIGDLILTQISGMFETVEKCTKQIKMTRTTMVELYNQEGAK